MTSTGGTNVRDEIMRLYETGTRVRLEKQPMSCLACLARDSFLLTLDLPPGA
jgi:hypothetical protein